MKKLIAFLFSLLFCLSVFSFDFTIKGLNPEHSHNSYVVSYDVYNQNPNYVYWTLTAKEAIAVEKGKGNRSSKFEECKKVVTQTHEAYTNTKYDRGHMCPNNDRDWSFIAAKDTFCMCNICPQTHKLNAGIWKTYEEYGHTLAKKYGHIDICCGPIFIGQAVEIKGKKGFIIVPQQFFKIFYNKEQNFLECYIFDQNNSYKKSSIKEIEKLTGLTFTF